MNFKERFVLFAFLAFFITLAQATENNSSQICIQNFNAYGPGYAPAIKSRTNRWGTELLDGKECEVIQLQEVWKQKHVTQVEDIFKNHYIVSSPNKEAMIGVMSLFSGDIIGEETRLFSTNYNGGALDGIRKKFDVVKAFHIVEAKFPQISDNMYFVNIHLHPTSQTVRIAQLLEIVDWRLKHQDYKFILTGDFNANPNDLEHSLVSLLLGVHDSMKNFKGEYVKGDCTYCKSNILGWLLTDQIFDYIYYSNIGNAKSVMKEVDGGVNLKGTKARPYSDHFGIKMVLKEDFNYEETKEEELNQRYVDALAAIDEAIEVLEKKNKKGNFNPQIEYLISLKMQLHAREGVFFDYFQKYL